MTLQNRIKNLERETASLPEFIAALQHKLSRNPSSLSDVELDMLLAYYDQTTPHVMKVLESMTDAELVAVSEGRAEVWEGACTG